MQAMDNFFEMVRIEKAQQMKFRPGTPPVIVFETEEHPLEGPPLSAESIEELLRGIAGTRQMRRLRETGYLEFMHAFQGRTLFLIRARMADQQVVFDIL